MKRRPTMSRVMKFLVKITALTGMLVGLPLLGVYITGLPVTRYLEFPPQTRFVQHESFSWLVFVATALEIAIVVVLLSIWVLKSYRRSGKSLTSPPVTGFPWWGLMAVATGLISWIAAWTRFSWIAEFQAHTFVPLWLSYIVVINALTYRRTGHCMMIDRPAFFLCLFPASAAFWWYFEYLNRFVQNWHYVGAQYGPWTYFSLATLSFSTVLPAVLGTREWILSQSWIQSNAVSRKEHAEWRSGPVPSDAKVEPQLDSGCRVLTRGSYLAVFVGRWFDNRFEDGRPEAKAWWQIVPWCVLAASGIGLALIGVLPNYLYPLVWVSPLVIIVSLQAILRERHIVLDMVAGRWHPSISAALAALVCGWFWEMWNYHSLAKWEYSIPFVDRFHIFEMPILGYGGYLPFGLECLVVGLLLERLVSGDHVGKASP